MSPFSALAWTALLLIPSVAILGAVLRRAGKGPMVARMRPHLLLGYAAALLALVHAFLSANAMSGANTNGIWLATLALFGLGLQAFVGTNLQSPGTYRVPLRRWHLLLFWAILSLSIGHVFLNSAMSAQSTASAPDRVLAHRQ